MHEAREKSDSRPKLLAQLTRALKARRYSPRTLATYRSWVVRYVKFHGTRHPSELGADEVNLFLTHIAADLGMGPSAQGQARAALLFLYREVLRTALDKVEPSNPVLSGKQPRKLPVVLTRAEAGLVLRAIRGRQQLIAAVLYGSGLRLSEGLQLRAKDLDLKRRELVVRAAKGGRDRVSMIPASLVPKLEDCLTIRRALHERDLAGGFGWAVLPDRFARKAPRAGFEFGWQFIFPASTITADPKTGASGRHHLHKTSVQRAVSAAGRTVGLAKRVSCHTFRHSFATHLLEDGYDIRSIQELLGHRSVKTTMIYTHVLNRGGMGIRSPLDTVWLPD
jgi:integron integrase